MSDTMFGTNLAQRIVMLSLRSSLSIVLSFALLALACGGKVSGAGSSGSADNAGPAGAENPSQAGGASPSSGTGVCCPARIGGCALMGGYSANGRCDQGQGTICDNMCEQRIVKDEHGCDVLSYKNPPVSTTYAGPESCSDPVFNGHGYNGPCDVADGASPDLDAGCN